MLAAPSGSGRAWQIRRFVAASLRRRSASSGSTLMSAFARSLLSWRFVRIGARGSTSVSTSSATCSGWSASVSTMSFAFAASIRPAARASPVATR